MAKKLIFLFSAFLLTANAWAQLPDLSLSFSLIENNNLAVGNYLKMIFRVKNTGTGNAAACHSRIYMATSASTTNASLLGEISCQQLAAGEETANISYIFPIPYNITPGIKNIIIKLDARNTVTESGEANDFVTTTPLVISTDAGRQQNLLYPILLLHGLGGDYRNWDSLKNSLQNNYGWSYGGNLNFCLNQDGNTATANKILDYKDWSDTGSLKPADFYTINFNVGVNGEDLSLGNSSVQSNQAAIVKQGIAVKDAVRHILRITGKDKVVLLGHSMGGMASREYIQNAANWQSDGKHHVAKLATLGSPHGGSNTSAWGFSGLAGINERSEAVRDLRYDYFYSGAPGVFLFGGTESNSVMSNFLFSNYFNIDVNCNGLIDAAPIQGLNQKSIPEDIAYASVIGDGSALGGDGVVDADRANINNYYAIGADTFVTISASVILHLDLLNQIGFTIKSIDEPGKFTLAYQADTGRYYFGNFSEPSKAFQAAADSDYFKIPIPENGELSVECTNIPVNVAGIKITDSLGRGLLNQISGGRGYFLTSVVPVSAGVHGINIYGLPETNTWLSPYAWRVHFNGYGICPGNNRVFNAGITGSSYQWQVDTGSGFVTVNNNNVYTGAASRELTLLAPPASWYGYRYRCLVNGSTYSPVMTLKYAARWTGMASSEWENPANWNCGVLPDEKTDVYIYSGAPNFPVVNNQAVCRSIQVKQGSLITINPNARLLLTGER